MSRKLRANGKPTDALTMASAPKVAHLRRDVARARLEGLSPDGHVLIRLGDIVARAEIAVGCTEAELVAAIRTNQDALVVFINGDPRQPVVTGLIRTTIGRDAAISGADMAVRERFITLEATEGIKLQSGESTIELRADGRVEIRGVEVLSAAETSNRVQGGFVGIN